MAMHQRYRRGPQKVFTGKIQTLKKVQIGDLCAVLSSGYVVGAGNFAVSGSGSGPGGTDALTEFKTAFAGALVEGATTGTETTDTPCVVGHAGVYEYLLSVAADADYPPGTPLKAVVGTGFLKTDTLAIDTTRTKSFAVAANEIKNGDLTVLAELVSSIMAPPLT